MTDKAEAKRIAETRLTTALLRRASSIARKANDIGHTLNAAFVERYGISHNDCDCDWLIDDLDYGLGNGTITLKDADKWMADAGYPPLGQAVRQHLMMENDYG